MNLQYDEPQTSLLLSEKWNHYMRYVTNLQVYLVYTCYTEIVFKENINVW